MRSPTSGAGKVDTRPESADERKFFGSAAAWRVASIAGFVAVALWVVWWGYSMYASSLFGASKTQITIPFFGADFISQHDLAARRFAKGFDPYESRGHLFHYPPLVIRLFLWTPLMSIPAALRVWIVVLSVWLVLGTVAAVRVRRRLAVGQIPASLAIALILYSFPAIFQLERANFDLITLAALLVAVALHERKSPAAQYVAGAVLAIGPWVKLYPGLMGLGLVALRRWKMIVGFVVAGVGIFLAAPAETMRSFDVLKLAVERIKYVSIFEPYYTWAHSLSVAYLKFAQLFPAGGLREDLLKVPMDAVGGVIVLASGVYVSYRIYKLPGCDRLFYPLLLWLNALASCVGVIANDYSLIFLPIAAIAVHSFRDPWFVRVAMLLHALWWQPFNLHIPAIPLLVLKLLGLVSVAVSLLLRAKELSLSHRTQEVVEPRSAALPANLEGASG